MNETHKNAIHELLEIALTTPKETADVFFQWSPHCNSFSVNIHLGGWTRSSNYDKEFAGYLNAGMSSEAYILSLPEKLREYLSSENIEEIKAAKKAKHVADLKAQLEAAQQ